MNFTMAKAAFETYLDQYDREDDKVRLKMIHTYGVVAQASEIARRMQLSEENTELAMLIALLHDIGRFEQIRRFDSFAPDLFNHASYGVEILFGEGLIRKFIPEDTWDDIIRTAIAHHSDYRLEGIASPRALFHARLIRDADKLDNCRVKLTDSLETMLGVTPEELGSQEISPAVYDSVFENRCILSSDRVTAMDHWVSYVAYFFDINFRESLQIIKERQYLSRIIDRIPYSNPRTASRMEAVREHLRTYIMGNL